MVPPCIWFVLPIFHEWNAVQLNSHVPTTCYGCQLCYCPNYVQLCCFGHAVRSGRSTYHWSDGLGSCRQVFEKAAALLQDDTVARLPPTSTSFMVNSQVHSIHRPFLFKNVLLPWFLGKEVLQIIPKRQRLRSWVRWDCCGLLWSRHGFNIRKQCIDPCDALLNPCCVGQEWLKDFGHDDFRLAMHFSTLIKKNVHSRMLVYCWVILSYWVYTQYRQSIPRSMNISQILRNLLSGIQVGFANRCRLGAIVVASRGICFQKVLVCLSCLRHAVAGWALERFFVIPRWPEYLGMRQIHGMRFGACMAVPQKPMFPWRSARSG